MGACGKPHEGLHRIFPSRDFTGQPVLLRLALPDEPPKIPAPCTTLSPIPLKKSSAWATFCGATTKILLVGSRKYPLGGALACRYQRWAKMCVNFPPAPRYSGTTAMLRIGVPPKLPYKGEYPYAIGNNGKGGPLCYALLAVQEVT